MVEKEKGKLFKTIRSALVHKTMRRQNTRIDHRRGQAAFLEGTSWQLSVIPKRVTRFSTAQ